MTLVAAFVLSLMMVPVVRWFSFQVGRVDRPREDRWHRQPTPKLGGMGMFAAFALSLATAGLYHPAWSGLEARWSILVGAVLMFALGLYDDFKRIHPPAKLAGQMVAATIVIFFGGYTIDFFPWPVANIILTFFWLVGITNAINLLDNMDGLAGGVSLIAAGVLSYFFWHGGNSDLLLISLALAGAILGFLVFNFPPAKIFMGDSGSLLLGFTLATLAIARRTQASNIFAVVAVPTLLFLLPILDTGLVTLTRLLRGQSPAQGGTDHTSHRLIAFGLTERQAVLVLYGVALISGLAATSLEALNYDLSLILVPAVLIAFSLFVGYLARLKVVAAPQKVNGNHSNGGITRLMGELTYKRRVFEIVLDLMLIGFSYYLAFWTRYGLDMTEISMGLFLKSWPLALGAAYLSFYLFGVYRGVWRYVGFNDLVRYAVAALAAGGLAGLAAKVVYPLEPYTLDVFVLFTLFLLLGLAGTRSSFQLLDRLYSQRRGKAEKTSVLLYGAEDAGEMALRWIMRNPDLGYLLAGFLDEDPYKWGRSIHGVSVLGGVTRLEDILGNQKVAGVIVTTGELLGEENGKRLLEICRQRGVWVRVMRLEFELKQ